MSTEPDEEVAFDVAMLEHGVPIDLIGRAGALTFGPGWGHPESNPLRDVQEFIRFAEWQYPTRDDLSEDP